MIEDMANSGCGRGSEIIRARLGAMEQVHGLFAARSSLEFRLGTQQVSSDAIFTDADQILNCTSHYNTNNAIVTWSWAKKHEFSSCCCCSEFLQEN